MTHFNCRLGDVNMFGINIDNLTLEEACKIIIEKAKNKNKYEYVVTPNVDHIIKLQKDKEFFEVYENAALVLPDGMPLIWASKILGQPLKERVTGSDVFPLVCEMAENEGLSVYFLGGLEGVADKAKVNLLKKHPNLKIVGVYSPPFGFENDMNENKKIISLINNAKPDILFVGVGAPKQEKWIYHNLSDLKVPISLGIGASFDFIAGTINRAPKWMQKNGIEWLWRFGQEPKRLFRRYFIEDIAFINIVIKERKVKNKNKNN